MQTIVEEIRGITLTAHTVAMLRQLEKTVVIIGVEVATK